MGIFVPSQQTLGLLLEAKIPFSIWLWFVRLQTRFAEQITVQSQVGHCPFQTDISATCIEESV